MFCLFPRDRLLTSAAIACCLWLQLRSVLFYLRQQDQALQSQRHTVLQRLNHLQCTAATRQHIVSGRADAHLPVLVRRCVTALVQHHLTLLSVSKINKFNMPLLSGMALPCRQTCSKMQCCWLIVHALSMFVKGQQAQRPEGCCPDLQQALLWYATATFMLLL